MGNLNLMNATKETSMVLWEHSVMGLYPDYSQEGTLVHPRRMIRGNWVKRRVTCSRQGFNTGSMVHTRPWNTAHVAELQLWRRVCSRLVQEPARARAHRALQTTLEQVPDVQGEKVTHEWRPEWWEWAKPTYYATIPEGKMCLSNGEICCCLFNPGLRVGISKKTKRHLCASWNDAMGCAGPHWKIPAKMLHLNLTKALRGTSSLQEIQETEEQVKWQQEEMIPKLWHGTFRQTADQDFSKSQRLTLHLKKKNFKPR